MEKILRKLRSAIEVKLNSHLTKLTLKNKFEKWAVIFVSVSDEFSDFFEESFVARRNPDVMGIRLIIDFNAFSKGSEMEKMHLMIKTLHRSVEKMAMPKFKISEEEREKLNEIINTVEKELELEIN
ncbi:hypothetical protein R6242_22140 [Iodobacter sp. CM08]|uniref:hypothetical protein n=1 Tax=Iodobacter sp. CM08 TaxID=3085902 RepID=UPI0029817D3A|nr:hypothetical protein [Iodobacter sp. CM08]MDW5419277.1 hypothetical protein [Iodobacter sp. CM08]